MANREKGEVAITIADKTYTLVLDTNAMVALETLFSDATRDVTFDQVLARINAGSVRHIRGLIWAALQRYHSDIGVLAVGDLIQAAGGLAAFTNQLTAIIKATAADGQDLKSLGSSKGNPRKAQTRTRGTGGRSTATRGASV